MSVETETLVGRGGFGEVGADQAISTWPQFAKQVRSKGCVLLRNLHKFDDPVLVTGCQRSGTTILSRALRNTPGMADFQTRRDDELEAALILSGIRSEGLPGGRYCFQTTYLNECYKEYLAQDIGFRIVWVIRNPHSVVYSMLHNWGRFAFNELFQSVGRPTLERRSRLESVGDWAIPRIRRACASYSGKMQQLLELRRHLSEEKLAVVDYDELVRDKEQVFQRICRFADIDYRSGDADIFSGGSIGKASRLTSRERHIIEREAMPVYACARGLAIL